MASPGLDRELKKGSAELLVLSLVEDRPRHGYEIVQLIELRSRGALLVNVASLYALLYGGQTRGWNGCAWALSHKTYATGCECCGRIPASPSWRCWRWRSGSARTPRSSASSTPFCCSRCPTRIRDSWSCCGRTRLISASPRIRPRPRTSLIGARRTQFSPGWRRWRRKTLTSLASVNRNVWMVGASRQICLTC